MPSKLWMIGRGAKPMGMCVTRLQTHPRLSNELVSPVSCPASRPPFWLPKPD